MDRFFPVRNTEEDTKLEFYTSLIDFYKIINSIYSVKFRNPLFEYKRTDLTLVDAHLIPFLVLEFKGDYGTCTQAQEQLRAYSAVVKAPYYGCILGYSLQKHYFLELYDPQSLKFGGAIFTGFATSMKELINILFSAIKFQKVSRAPPIEEKEYRKYLRNEASLKFELGRALKENGLDVAIEYGLMKNITFSYSNRVDIAIVTKEGNIIPIEVKAKDPGIEGFSQVDRYMRAFNSTLGALAYYDKKGKGIIIELYNYQNESYKKFNIALVNINGLDLVDEHDISLFIQRVFGRS